MGKFIKNIIRETKKWENMKKVKKKLSVSKNQRKCIIINIIY